MPESDHEKVRRLFDLVAAAAPQDRGALLDHECGGDAALRARIESMLAALDDDRFLSEPTRPDAPTVVASDLASAATIRTPSLRERPGTRIGPYKLLQAIGEGGFGSVFMAEQERPVVRKVALKIIKLGMDTHQVVARFEQERQALALMDHPNIAKVFDAGATETGRPYFVMELVKGEAIVEYCDKHNLSVHDRLELFAQVCQAVQHAHTKGVIHRDIKPSNVLVSMQDGRAHAKVIDFGIAKATASKLTEKTLFTEHRALIGTPEYMSPEQAEGSLDIDTRTDVYSLGVLLYELLTGTTPFSGKELRSAAYAEIQRIIREVEPPRPSTRISANTESLASVAASRHTEPKRLGALVRGELDWIVMKALEKDRQRRYETANGLMMDVRRYLSGEAVMAAPPSAGYRIKKFVKRHRWPVAAASMVGVALIIGVVGTTVGMRQAIVARAAERERAEGEAKARQQAELRLGQVETANEVLGSIFSNLNPQRIAESGRPLQALLVEDMDSAIDKLQGEATGDPLTVAKLQTNFGNALMHLGEPAKAVVLLERALATRKKMLGESDPLTFASMNNLAASMHHTRNFERAGELAREVIRLSRTEDGKPGKEAVTALGHLSSSLFDQNKTDEAIAVSKECIAANSALWGPEHEKTANAIANLGFIYQQINRGEDAIKQFEEAERILRLTMPPEHPQRMALINNLASAYWNLRKLDQSIPIFEELLAAYLHSFGPDHPRTLLTTANLGVNYAAAKRLEDAIPRLERAWSGVGKHGTLLFAGETLLQCYFKTGRLDEARAFAPKYLAQSRLIEKPGSGELAKAIGLIALCFAERGMFAEMAPYASELDSMQSSELWQTAGPKSWFAKDLAKAAAKDDKLSMPERVALMDQAEKLALDAIKLTTPGPQLDREKHSYHISAFKRAVSVFKSRHELEPDKGYDQRAAELREKGKAIEADGP